VAFFVDESCVKAAAVPSEMCLIEERLLPLHPLRPFGLTLMIQPKVEKNKPLIYCVKDSYVI